MRVLIVEDNLLWSSRLFQAIRALGHETVVFHQDVASLLPIDFAVVGLAYRKSPLPPIIADLKHRKIFVLAHSGHADKDLIEQGREMACDRIVTNGSLTAKLQEYLQPAT